MTYIWAKTSFPLNCLLQSYFVWIVNGKIWTIMETKKYNSPFYYPWFLRKYLHHYASFYVIPMKIISFAICSTCAWHGGWIASLKKRSVGQDIGSIIKKNLLSMYNIGVQWISDYFYCKTNIICRTGFSINCYDYSNIML